MVRALDPQACLPDACLQGPPSSTAPGQVHHADVLRASEPTEKLCQLRSVSLVERTAQLFEQHSFLLRVPRVSTLEPLVVGDERGTACVERAGVANHEVGQTLERAADRVVRGLEALHGLGAGWDMRPQEREEPLLLVREVLEELVTQMLEAGGELLARPRGGSDFVRVRADQLANLQSQLRQPSMRVLELPDRITHRC
ncbi:MAG TPA: hypothetical protein VIF09_14240 [Polyangiaceae bacterium]